MGFEVRQVGGFAYSAHIVLKFLWTLCGVVFGLTAWGGLCFGKEKMRASSTCTSSACTQWANLFTLSIGEFSVEAPGMRERYPWRELRVPAIPRAERGIFYRRIADER